MTIIAHDTTTFSAIDIKRTFNVFRQPGELVEVRILGINDRSRRHGAAGYFFDLHAAATAAALWDEHRQPEAIYFTLNAIDPALHARSPEQITEYLDTTTADHDVIRRRWLLVDCDPVRPKGISSSDAEREAARVLHEEVRVYLHEMQHWSEPVHAMSGNGYHLLFPIDLPNDGDSLRAVNSILKGLAAQFAGFEHEGHKVAIDTVVSNASRITKLYGTMARKGHNTPERPHRASKLTYVPDYLDHDPRVEVAFR